jgi:hypothetical protein
MSLILEDETATPFTEIEPFKQVMLAVSALNIIHGLFKLTGTR